MSDNRDWNLYAESGCIVETRRDSKELSVQWKFKLLSDYEDCYSEGVDAYDSPVFEFSDASWYLIMFLKDDARFRPIECMDLFLCRKDEGPPMTIQFTLGLEKVRKREAEEEFSIDYPSFGWYEFLSRHELRSHQPILMPLNRLIISCRIKIVTPSPARDSPIQMDEKLKEAKASSEESHSSEKQGIEKVAEDFGKLLVSCENSDITVQVGDTEFSVHRSILSARCPVLSAMFQHQTAEKASNKIIVKGCEPDIFRDFLQYLYTGSIQSITQKNVFSIYRIADQYLAEDLKLHCLKHIREALCVQTFCDTIKLALTHGKSGLLKLAIDFAIENIQLIVSSVEWQIFICECPREANEILIKCLVPRS